MHSIGIEHEGFAAQGARWYTESLYQSSATLVQYLANKYSVKLDRAHIIGHDQVPGIIPALVAGMHWDPAPFWDWEHYFESARRADRQGGGRRASQGVQQNDVVTVKPGFDAQPAARDGLQRPDRQRPTRHAGRRARTSSTCTSSRVQSSPLVTDVGLHPDGSPSTDRSSGTTGPGWRLGRSWSWSVRVRVLAGCLVSRPDRLVGVVAASTRTVVPSTGRVVTAKAGASEVPVYGRAYPEASAYDGTRSSGPGRRPAAVLDQGRAEVRPRRWLHRHDVLLLDDLRRVRPDQPHRGERPGQVRRDLVRSPDVLRPQGRHLGRVATLFGQLNAPCPVVERVKSRRARPPVRSARAGSWRAVSRSGRRRCWTPCRRRRRTSGTGSGPVARSRSRSRTVRR